MARRIRITVAYDGTEFHGWQVQPGLTTIQGILEEIIFGIDKKPVHVAGSGRTDAGVHARAQVAAFTLENRIPVDNLRRAINRLLPPAIRVLEVVEAHPDFHPRFDSTAKTYQYTIHTDEICPPAEWRYVHWHPYPINRQAMVEAASVFDGEHDFTAFAAKDPKDTPEKSKVRRIFSSRLEINPDGRLIYRVRGSGFLKHMVRNLVGTLLHVGKGNFDQADLEALLQPNCNRKCGPTAPAKGLTLWSVEYGQSTDPESPLVIR